MENGIEEVFPNGRQEWRLNGLLHRLDGPAVILRDGSQFWNRDGKLHRLDGPAVIYPNRRHEWWVDWERHRLDGPAIINPDGSQEWWVEGKAVDVMEVFGYLPSVPLSEEEQMILVLSLS